VVVVPDPRAECGETKEVLDFAAGVYPELELRPVAWDEDVVMFGDCEVVRATEDEVVPFTPRREFM
jgi:hypothetical protein